MNSKDRDMFIAVGLTIATAIFSREYNSIVDARNQAEKTLSKFWK